MKSECSNCCGKIGVKVFDTSPGAHIPEKKVRLCIYCAGSAAGNAFFYPRQYGDGANVLKGMASMMNLLEERVNLLITGNKE